MAFEQNPMLQQLSQSGMNQYKPMGHQFQDINEPKRGFWENAGNFLRDYFMGSKDRTLYGSPLTGEQGSGIHQLLQMGMGNMQNPYEGFQGLADESTRNFNENIVPGLAERFTQTGASSSSPAFSNALGNAGAGLQSMLNAQKSNYGMENKKFGLMQAQQGLTPLFEQAFDPGKQGAFSKTHQNIQNLAPLLLKLAMMG